MESTKKNVRKHFVCNLVTNAGHVEIDIGRMCKKRAESLTNVIFLPILN